MRNIQGGEETFGQNYSFTEDLRAHLSALLPKLDVQVLVYPKYETRGDLADCVSRFRDWLQEKVIDLEVAKGTPSPTVEPSVRVVLCGHSMGGIVAAETVIALTSDRVIPPAGSTSSSGPGSHNGEGGGGATTTATSDGNQTAAPAENDQTPLNSLMFPYIQGVLSFDTPYLGKQLSKLPRVKTPKLICFRRYFTRCCRPWRRDALLYRQRCPNAAEHVDVVMVHCQGRRIEYQQQQRTECPKTHGGDRSRRRGHPRRCIRQQGHQRLVVVVGVGFLGQDGALRRGRGRASRRGSRGLPQARPADRGLDVGVVAPRVRGLSG